MSRSKINAVAFISPQNHPILIRSYPSESEHIKYHYIAHTSLDVIEERGSIAAGEANAYLGLLYAIEDVAVYGYQTPLKVKIVIAMALSDSVVRDVEVNTIFKALHMAFYYSAISNPFLKLDASAEATNDPSPYLLAGSSKWHNFRRRIDDICNVASNPSTVSSSS
ncbi:Sedlin, N-terminal conserved region-domain-containing protein [Mycena amicta]|nr:Sedlin, N-terminal conserved region-domain-containing protein [Mycena amicta]